MFTIDHGLRCKKGGGLVGIQHEDTHNKASAPAALALPNGKVAYKLMINYGRDITETRPMAPRQTGIAAGEEARGDVPVHGLWEQVSGCILYT